MEKGEIKGKTERHETETERQRQRDRQTDRQTSRQTDRRRRSWMDRQTSLQDSDGLTKTQSCGEKGKIVKDEEIEI